MFNYLQSPSLIACIVCQPTCQNEKEEGSGGKGRGGEGRGREGRGWGCSALTFSLTKLVQTQCHRIVAALMMELFVSGCNSYFLQTDNSEGIFAISK